MKEKDKRYEVKATLKFKSEEERNEFLKQVDFIEAIIGLPDKQTTICQAVYLIDYLYRQDIKQKLCILTRNIPWGLFTHQISLPKKN